MTEKKTENFNLNSQNEKSAFELLGEKLKTLMFGVTFVLLKQQSFSLWAEMTFIILQFLQFMAFAFRPVVIFILLILYSLGVSGNTKTPPKAWQASFSTSKW